MMLPDVGRHSLELHADQIGTVRQVQNGLAKQHQIRPALTGAPLIIYGRKCEVARPTRLAALFSQKNKAQRSAPTDRGLCKEVQDHLRSNFAG